MPGKPNEKLLKNVSSVHKKVPWRLEMSINLETQHVAKNLKLAGRIEHYAKAERAWKNKEIYFRKK